MVRLSAFATDAAGQLDVLGHDGNSLGVDGAQVGVLEESNQVGLASFLKGHDSRALETQVSLEILSDLTDESLEGKLADQKLSALLVTPDLTQSHGTGPVTVGLLDSAGCGSALPGCLGSELLPRSLASGRLTGSLLGSGHRV